MKTVSISGSPRVSVGKKDAKALRANGNVPCTLYGGTDQINFFAPYNDFRHVVYTPDVNKVVVKVDGKEYETLLQEIQFHPVNDKIMHIDFLQLFPDKPVIIDIPVVITGSSAGVKAGGKMAVITRKLKIKALPAHLPDFISVDISSLEIGQSKRVGDLTLENVHFLDTPNRVIVAVQMTRAVVEEPKAAAAATPAAGAAGAKAAAPAAAAGAKAPAAAAAKAPEKKK
jgi:large subunit ribosomal protein L25